MFNFNKVCGFCFEDKETVGEICDKCLDKSHIEAFGFNRKTKNLIQEKDIKPLLLFFIEKYIKNLLIDSTKIFIKINNFEIEKDYIYINYKFKNSVNKFNEENKNYILKFNNFLK